MSTVSSEEHVEPFDPRDLKAPKVVRGVYFLHAPLLERVKIGWSDKVFSRVTTICTGSPEILTLRFVLDLPNITWETELHKRFAPLNTHLEWFDQCVLGLVDDFPRIEWIKDIELSGNVRDKFMAASWPVKVINAA